MKANFKKFMAVIAATAMCAITMASAMPASAVGSTVGDVIAFSHDYGCGNEPHVLPPQTDKNKFEMKYCPTVTGISKSDILNSKCTGITIKCSGTKCTVQSGCGKGISNIKTTTVSVYSTK